MTTTPTDAAPPDRVLFEWRIAPDGTLTITTSPEWDDYHYPHGSRQRHLSALRDTLQRLDDELYDASDVQQE